MDHIFLRNTLLLLFCLSAFTFRLPAQETDPRVNFAEHIFEEDSILEVTLVSDFRSFRKNKFDDEYQPAWISFMTADGNEFSDSIRIKPRGSFRRERCTYPPIRLSFEKSAFTRKDTSSFMDKIKLVSYCESSPTHQQYIIREYLIYKLYEVLTEYSMRTRLLNIKFIDTWKGKNKERESLAFMIEDIGQVGYRTRSLEIEPTGLKEELFQDEPMIDMAVFHFMVGNTDWSITTIHNLKFLKSLDPTVYEPIAVPYDFDYSGVVDANYAIPSDKLPIDDVTQRLYRGKCRSPEEYERSFKRFRTLKPEFMEIVNNCPWLTKQSRNEVIDYLEEFYHIIDNPGRVRYYFLENCGR